MSIPISDWSFFSTEKTAYISYQIEGIEIIRKILKVKTIQQSCWRFYFEILQNNPESLIFILSERVRYRDWPKFKVSPGIVRSFIADNKITLI